MAQKALAIDSGDVFNERRRIAMQALEDNEVVMQGHFRTHLLNYHTSTYFRTRPLFKNGGIWSAVQDLVALIPMSILEQVTVVAGPQNRGDIIAHLIARVIESHRSSRVPVMCVPIENRFHLIGKGDIGRTERFVPEYYHNDLVGAQVLFVDDAIITGSTKGACKTLLEDHGATVVAFACLVDSSYGKSANQFAIWSIGQEGMFQLPRCPLCEANVPITEF